MGTLNVAAILIFAAIVATPVRAQEPAPCAQPALAQLRFLTGTWTVHARVRLSANPADWEESVGTARIESVIRDCALLERFSGTRRGRPYEALRLFAAKANGQGLQFAATDSEHGPLFLFDSTSDAEARAFFLRVTTPAGMVVLRLRFIDVGQDGFVAVSERSADGGASWDLTGRTTYRRQPADPQE